MRVLAACHRAPLAALGSSAGWIVGLVIAGWAVRGADGDAVEVATALGRGFSIGLVVAAVWLVVTIRLVSGDAATRGLARTAGAALLGAVVAGWGFSRLVEGTQAGVWVSVIMVLAIGLASTAIVLGVVLAADPDAAKSALSRWQRGART